MMEDVSLKEISESRRSLASSLTMESSCSNRQRQDGFPSQSASPPMTQRSIARRAGSSYPVHVEAPVSPSMSSLSSVDSPSASFAASRIHHPSRSGGGRIRTRRKNRTRTPPTSSRPRTMMYMLTALVLAYSAGFITLQVLHSETDSNNHNNDNGMETTGQQHEQRGLLRQPSQANHEMKQNLLNVATEQKYESGQADSDTNKDLFAQAKEDRQNAIPANESPFDFAAHMTRNNDVSSSTAANDPNVFFYHIYIPNDHNQASTENALRIVQEQLQQLGGSQQEGKKHTIHIFYNLVGQHAALPESTMTEWCAKQKIRCHSMHSYDQGFETVTLQAVHDFCQSPSTSSTRVGYLHNKGSHHATEINEEWRRLMTHAIARPECWSDHHPSAQQQQQEEEPCNLCGLYYTADRGQYMSGNIWTSTCEYIQRLLPPRDFEPRMTEVAQQAFLRRLNGKFQMSQYPHLPEYFGIGRYADEWWSGSHPTVRPCDFSASLVSASSSTAGNNTTSQEEGDAPDDESQQQQLTGYDNTKVFLNWVGMRAEKLRNRTMAANATATASTSSNRPPSLESWQSQGLELQFAPRAPTQTFKWAKPNTVKRMMKQSRKRREVTHREYFWLPGILFRWIELYQQVPSRNSWVYSYYPEGKFWRFQVSKNGLNTVDRIATARATT